MKQELKKYMTIGITEDSRCGIMVSPDMEASEAYLLIGTLAKHILTAYYDVAEHSLPDTMSDKDREVAAQGIKESMYDAFDTVMSNVLNEFYPDAPSNSIEDEAILELTNKKIEEKYKRLPKKQRELYKRQYNVIKTKLQLTPKTKDSDKSEDSKKSNSKHNLNTETEAITEDVNSSTDKSE